MRQYLLIVALLFQTLLFAQTADPQKLMDKGIMAYGQGNYPKAISLFTECVGACRTSGDTKLLGKAYNNLANSLSQTGQSDKALENYQLSLKASEKIADSLNISKTSKNIGALYSEQKDFAPAMQHYNTALAYARRIKDNPLIADCLNNMGVVYEQQEHFVKALSVYREALAIYRNEGDESRIAMTLNNLAIVYKYLKQYPESIKNYEASLVLSQKIGDRFMVAANRNNLGNVYALTGNHQKALELCRMAYNDAKAIEAQEVIIEAAGGMALAYENLGQYREALRCRELYEKEKDSFINTERSAQLADMQVKYETSQKEAQIKLLNSERKVQALVIERRGRLIAICVLLIGALLSIGYAWRSRQKLRNARLVHDTEEQERLRIAKDIHDDLGSGLTKINFLSEIIMQKTEALPDVRSNSEAVQETARRMVESMRDLIWALNPGNTTLASLIARMREYTSDYLEDYPASLQFDIADDIPQDAITKESHRELLMVVKEGINNIAKHANANNILFSVRKEGNVLQVALADDGKGFIKGDYTGNGLRNMESRIAGIGGQFTMESHYGEGTKIIITLPLERIIRKPAA